MEKNIIGIYSEEEFLLPSIKKLQEKGIKIKEVFSPFPIFEVIEALKLKTRIPLAAFIYGTLGVTGTYAFLYWTSVISYPLNFGGKPQNTLSFLILLFVATILVTTILLLSTLFMRQKLYPGKEAKVLVKEATDDKFVILIDITNEMNEEDISLINSILSENGAEEVRNNSLQYDL